MDIGGSVQTLEGRVKSFKPDEYVILDNGSEEKSHEKWNKPDIEYDINQEITIPKDDPYIGWTNFDQIFMIEVSEYLYDPLQALKNINQLLKKGGVFYSSWHFLYCQHPPKGKDFLRYTPDAVEFLHKKAGFKIIEHIPRVLKDDFSKSTLMALITNEGMRGWKEFDNTIIGSIVKARK